MACLHKRIHFHTNARSSLYLWYLASVPYSCSYPMLVEKSSMLPAHSLRNICGSQIFIFIIVFFEREQSGGERSGENLDDNNTA